MLGGAPTFGSHLMSQSFAIAHYASGLFNKGEQLLRRGNILRRQVFTVVIENR